ncbi:coiled-coil domain-containing protein 18-like isoform X2 [Dreissena polymorpha]|uniref:coiled-coil domain-containing protein 18-like isoform X2 n=1 Tax=Dreissena polymorpha TaxID=45954 RepID=UPI0022649D24|nr:coiled-coil domain-containing protein 18-like isoform X2 [Dreissena polymorpha]
MQNCYNTGERIPREKKFELDERLANKHIQTLQFVQEVVNENKILKKKVEELEESQVHCGELHAMAEESKEKIKVLQEQYLKRADEINAMMAEKHRAEMMGVVQEKLQQEQKYSEEIVQLRTEIGQLEMTNKELMERIQELTGSSEQMEVLMTEIEDQKRVIANLQMELNAVKDENEQLSGEKTSQFSQIQSLQTLKSQNEALAQDLKAMAHKNMELQFRVSKLEADLKEASNTKDQAELIDNLKTKLAKLHKERSIATEKEEYYQKNIGDLKYEVEKLREKLHSAEVTKDRVLDEYHRLNAELQHMKKNQSADSQNKNFKDFVKLKREVVNLKEENSELKQLHKAVFTTGSNTHLPMLRFEHDVPVVKSSASKTSTKSKKSVSVTSQ